jgi:hypothetical protein
MIEELLFEEESSTLDFKQEQYSFMNANEYQKGELLKDILAFANAWRRNDAYILIGIEEVKGGRSIVLGIENDLDDADLQQFVNSKTQRPLIFEYKNTQIDGKNIALIMIPINERPIYLKKDYGKLKKNTVYIRRGSSTDIATPDEVAKMGASINSEKSTPTLNLAFANRDAKLSLEKNIHILSKVLKFSTDAVIPDYEESTSYSQFDILASRRTVNKDYYRELLNYYYWKKISHPISFCISNLSDITATDIKIEIMVKADEDNITFLLEDKLPEEPSASHDYLENLPNIKSLPEHIAEMQIKPDIMIKLIENTWHIDVRFQKVQAGQTVFTKDIIYFSPKKEGEVSFNYKIFADNLPSPTQENLSVDVQVEKLESSLDEIIDEISERSYQEYLTKYSSQ